MVSCERASQKLSNGVSCFGVAPVFPGEVQNCTSEGNANVPLTEAASLRRQVYRLSHKLVKKSHFVVFLLIKETIQKHISTE